MLKNRFYTKGAHITRSKILLTLFSGDKNGFNFTGKTILSFIRVVLLSVTVQYR